MTAKKKKRLGVTATDDEKEMILELGNKGESTRAIAERIGRTSGFVFGVLSANGINNKKQPLEYTEEEDRIIREKYPVMGAKGLSLLIGRERHSIVNYATRRGINFSTKARKLEINRLNSKGFSVAQIAEQLKCSHTIVKTAISDNIEDKAYLYITTKPEDKAFWVACANRQGKKLRDWVIEKLNEAASQEKTRNA